MRDTSPAAEQRYFELLRKQSPVERLATAERLSTAVRELAIADIRARHPGATSGEINRRLAERLYGRAVADRLFPTAQGDAD